MTAHKKSSFMVRSPARRDDSRTVTLQKERWRARVITSTDLARHTTATGVSALLGECWHTVQWAQSNRCRLYTLFYIQFQGSPLFGSQATTPARNAMPPSTTISGDGTEN
jgi:hypothetical protein